jgi:hypothetical protein
MKPNHTIISAALACALAASLETVPAQQPQPASNLRELQFLHEVEVAEKASGPYKEGVARLNAAYLIGLERELATAKNAADLPGAVALDAEIKRLANNEALPASDDTAGEPLKKLRAIYRGELAKLDAKRAAAEATLREPFIAQLKALETSLTKAGDIGQAKTVLDFRTALATGGAPAAPNQASTPPTSSAPPPIGQKNVKTLGRGFNTPIAWEAMRQKPAAFTVIGQEPHRLEVGLAFDGNFSWPKVPQKLLDGGATIYLYSGERSGVSEFTVTNEGWLIIGVNYDYQGNNGNNWQEEAWSLDKFQDEGWELIKEEHAGGPLSKGDVRVTYLRNQHLLARFVKKDEKYRLRCNKYDQPFLIVLGGPK